MKGSYASFLPAIPVWVCVGVVSIYAQASVLAMADGAGEPASIPDTVAMQKEADALENAFTNTLGKLEKHGAAKSSASSDMMWWIAGLGLLGAVVLIKYVPGLLE